MIGYPWHTVVGAFPVALTEQGDEWLHRFTNAMANSPVSVEEQRGDATTAPFIRITLLQDGRRAETVVLLADTVDSVVVLLAGPSVADESLAAEVGSALQHATRTLGEDGDPIPWTAIIGPSPHRPGHRASRLGTEVSIGPMRMASTEQLLLEPDFSTQHPLSGWAITHSVPILVSGSSRGYDWTPASVDAARDLHTLCGILSVAMDDTIIVRATPAPVEWGNRELPASPVWYQHPEGVTDEFGLADATTFDPPGWIEAAWNRTRKQAYLVAAMDAYLEALQLMSRHPSLAAVGFVASVETIAGRLFKFERCEACKDRKGLGLAFKAALRMVSSDDDAEALDSIYNSRSRTVHDGRLHGGETAPGVPYRAVWSRNSVDDFRGQTLWRLRSATRRLLEWSLTTPRPARVPLPPASAGTEAEARRHSHS
ncbi:hypothetical protein [Amycolatopsis sp. MEPSY49]|uniref:hypothetical protein n=1 Tax=Amycolatopsis sp. MEPSY49 TaxID=3151600 RepID=UPI003EF9A4D3